MYAHFSGQKNESRERLEIRVKIVHLYFFKIRDAISGQFYHSDKTHTFLGAKGEKAQFDT